MAGSASAPTLPTGNIPSESWVTPLWGCIFAFGPYILCFVLFVAWTAWQRRESGHDIHMDVTIGSSKLTGSKTAFTRFLGTTAQDDLLQKLKDLENGYANLSPTPRGIIAGSAHNGPTAPPASSLWSRCKAKILDTLGKAKTQ